MPRPYPEIRADLVLARDRMKAASWTDKGKHAEIFAELVIEAFDALCARDRNVLRTVLGPGAGNADVL